MICVEHEERDCEICESPPDDDGPACADCRAYGHTCRPCMDDDIAERRAEARADREEEDAPW